ncbi:MAG: ribosome maturation factor RimM [Clostridia bacterium]|nr:ribosome maturation factor RimM [Clostridia bacterium]
MEYLRIGYIARPHGIRGGLKVVPLTDSVERFCGLSEAFLERGGEYAPIRLKAVGVDSAAAYIALEGCDSQEDAERLRGAYICVDRAHAVRLPEGRYFVVDLLGCSVETSRGVQIGTLYDVYETGANDVYRIRGEKKVAVPALKRLLANVDVASKRIVLDADVFEEVVLYED